MEPDNNAVQSPRFGLLAEKIAVDWFTIAPKHRTRARLAQHIEPLVYLVRQIPWISGAAASSYPSDVAHMRLREEIIEKAMKITVPGYE